jgi:hypothetical protein
MRAVIFRRASGRKSEGSGRPATPRLFACRTAGGAYVATPFVAMYAPL